MKVCRNVPNISHFMFAGGLLLLVKAMHTIMVLLVNVINKFCAMSGQKVNHDKSSIYFSCNVDLYTRVEPI